MKYQEGNFLKKVGKGVRNTIMGAATIGVLAHSVSQENPNTLSKDEVSIESIDSIYNKFDPDTKKELIKLEHDYISYYKTDFPNANDSVLKNRFESLIAKYGDGLRIVFTNGEHKALSDELNNLFFTKILRQRENRAHYVNNTVFYEDKPNRYNQLSEEGDSVLADVPNLDLFISEFSHHINEDTKIGRVVKYGEDLVMGGFSQSGLYEETKTIEYQAHSITESALEAYLYAKPEDQNISFEEIRNNFESEYENIVSRYGSELTDNSIDIACTVYGLNAAKHMQELEKYKADYIQRMDTMQEFVRAANRSDEEKKKLFESMITWDVLEKEYTGEMLTDYISASETLYDVSKEIKKKNFSSLDRISTNEAFDRNPALIGLLHIHLNESENSLDDFSTLLSENESRQYVEQVIPMYMHLTGALEKKLERKELSSDMCRVLVREIDNARETVERVYRKTSLRNDLEKMVLLKDLSNYTRLLESQMTQSNSDDLLNELSPNFFRYDHAKGLVENSLVK